MLDLEVKVKGHSRSSAENAYLGLFDLVINQEGQYASFLHLTLSSMSKVTQGEMQKNEYFGLFGLAMNVEVQYASFLHLTLRARSKVIQS